MKSRIWRLAGVGLLCISVSAQLLADERGDGKPPPQGHGNAGQHGEGHGDNHQSHSEPQQGRPQGNSQGNMPRAEHNQFDSRGQYPGGQWQARPHTEGSVQGHPAPPASNLPIQPRPDAVQQTQPPRVGYYQDIPRRGDNNPHWQNPGPGPRPGVNYGHPNDQPWPGRPDGHGNGWGAGPQYRPGYVVDRFPGQHWQVPYRGQNYFFSGGYWYRPQGPRYIVVQPPYGIRVGFLPDYAREVWFGSSLLFLAAGAYYAYQPATQDYIVVNPPTSSAPAAAGNGYDVVAYPANGQTPAQIDQDRYQCYQWAVQQSGFDPAQATYAPSPAVVQTYRQAEGNCLGSRGYQVNY